MVSEQITVRCHAQHKGLWTKLNDKCSCWPKCWMMNGILKCAAETHNPSIHQHLKSILSRSSQEKVHAFSFTKQHWGWYCTISTYMCFGFMFLGISNWHHLCPDVDRQPSQIQQHNENIDFEQQYGWTYLATRHHIQKLQKCWFPLDYNAQPATQDMEWWEDTLHLKVNTKFNTEIYVILCFR